MSTNAFSAIKPESIVVDKVVPLDNGYGKLVKLVHGENRAPLKFQTYLMPLSWDTMVRLQSGSPGCTLGLSLDSSAKSKDMQAWLQSFDKVMQGLVIKNAVEWAGSDISKEKFSDNYCPLFKKAKDEKYSPTFTPKVAFEGTEGNYKINLKAFTADKKQGDPSELLKKGAKVCAIISIPYIFIGKNGKTLAPRVEVTSCMVIPAPTNEEFCFNISEDPEIAQIIQEAQEAAQDDSSSSASTTSSPVSSPPRSPLHPPPDSNKSVISTKREIERNVAHSNKKSKVDDASGFMSAKAMLAAANDI